MNAPSIADLRLSVALTAVAALLAGAAAWPWLAEPAAASDVMAAAPEAGATAIVPLPPLVDFAAIVDRPLFAPSRRPNPPDGTLAAAGLRYRLIGIVAAGKDRHALLADPSGPRRIEIGEGAALDGWTVEQIEQDRVILSGPSGAAALTLGSAAEGKPAKP
jgi:hypothetical protein